MILGVCPSLRYNVLLAVDVACVAPAAELWRLHAVTGSLFF
jgi:hypothetical protein